MWETVVQFWQNNSSNIAVSLIVGFIFFVLGPLGLWFSGRRIRRERIRKAKDLLIDLLEGMIVNGADLNEKKLKRLLQSVAREVDVDLSGEYVIEHWLEDVALRFERSRHLSPEQKQTYYEVIRVAAEAQLTAGAEKSIGTTPRNYGPVLDDLKSYISEGNFEQATSATEELEQSLVRRERSDDPILNVFRIYQRIFRRSPVTFTIALIVVTIVYIALIIRFLPNSVF